MPKATFEKCTFIEESKRIDLRSISTIGIRQDHNTVNAQSIRNISNLLGDVLGSVEVDKVLGTGFQDQLSLASVVDANDPESDTACCNLCCEVTQACTHGRIKHPEPR
jgi:hypothetical protein